MKTSIKHVILRNYMRLLTGAKSSFKSISITLLQPEILPDFDFVAAGGIHFSQKHLVNLNVVSFKITLIIANKALKKFSYEEGCKAKLVQMERKMMR